MPRVILFVLLLGLATGFSQADDRIAQLIDQHIKAGLDAANVSSAPPISDHAFIRRVTLDLAGRVPTVAELESFLQAQESDKRKRLVQRLVDSPDFAFHQRNELDTLLLRRLEHHDAWREYLLEATQSNRPWDQVFREVMLPEDHLPDDSRSANFLVKRLRDIDATTNDTSVIWFGVNVACAKCHDHPLVFDWTQAHYYGMASFFKRTFQTRKGSLGERFEGQVRYTTTDGDEFDAEFMFLTGTKVSEPELNLDDEKLKELREAISKSEKDDKAPQPPKPDFRPRAQLVELALGDDQQRFFAKNIVNRIWARLMGRGLVHPLDQMHSENPASHPELLDALSQDLMQHQYDLKRLVCGIALSQTYARGADPDPGQPSNPEWFAAASPKPLSPHQLSLSCRLASTSPEKLTGLAGQENWAEARKQLESQSEGYARRFEIPEDGFQVSVSEALWFSNNQSVQNDFLNSGGDRLVGYLSRFDSPEEIAYRASRSILSRPPTSDELAMLTEYLTERSDRRQEAVSQIVWALLSSPEFRFNH